GATVVSVGAAVVSVGDVVRRGVGQVLLLTVVDLIGWTSKKVVEQAVVVRRRIFVVLAPHQEIIEVVRPLPSALLTGLGLLGARQQLIIMDVGRITLARLVLFDISL